MSIWENLEERLARWKTQSHDQLCEQQERSFICHCRKRARIARGLTELPNEDLYFPPPDCPVCDGDLEFDGDGFTCPTCSLSWDSSGSASSVQFTDDHGDNFGGEQFGRLLRAIADGADE